MSWLTKVGKSVAKIGKQVLKVAPMVTSFIPGVGPVVSKAINLAQKGKAVAHAVQAFAPAPPPPMPITMQPFDPVNVTRPPIPYETVRALVVAAYQRGRSDAVAAGL